MRWRRLGGVLGRPTLGILHTISQPSDLALEGVNLGPLRGYRLVQGLDHLILIGETDFKRVEPINRGFSHRPVYSL
jgi:hypothetical protein